jgi:hypothetical protein
MRHLLLAIIGFGLLVPLANAQSTTLTRYEYWFDEDDANRVSVNVSGQSVDLPALNISTDGLPLGAHQLRIRFGDNQGQWSSVVSRSFIKTVEAPYLITAVRYWLSSEQNPSDMQYHYFDAPTDSIDLVAELLDACMFPTITGTLKIQVRDNHGQWSSVITRPLTVTPPGTLAIDGISPAGAVCSGQQVTYTASIPSGHAIPTSYAWTLPNGWSIVSEDGPSITVTVGSTGGTISVTGSNACGSSAPHNLSVTVHSPGSPCDDGDPNTGNDVYDANCTCAGQLMDCTGIPGGTALPGTICDDADACTTGDVYDANCTCAGTFQDADNDGTCDANDLCAGGPEPGTSCSDGDACTTGDVIDANCTCTGTFQDSDGDGTCDANDLCPGGPEPGTPCDDGDPDTDNDVIDGNCNCVGDLVDCMGVPGGAALPGTACDDGDANTGNDIWDSNCNCAGELIDCEGVPGGAALPGTTCDDGDACTTGDAYDANCTCAGTFQDSDNDGTCDANDLCAGGPEPGTPCDDGDSETDNDVIDGNCNCVGDLVDCTGVPGGAALPGTACDDGDANTGNDTWDANCNCVGELIDCEGVPGGAALPGTTCDDGDACTTDDVYDTNCACAGIFQDTDNDGTCDANDLCAGGPEPGTPCDDGDANTSDDMIGSNCECLGTPLVVDCEGVPGGTALPGTPCDDGNPDTGNDTWTDDCDCMGDTTTVINGVSTTGWLSVHPNPSNGSFEVVPGAANASPITIEIYNGMGQLVLGPVTLSGSQPILLKLDDGKSDGIYFLRATTPGGSYDQKLIIQR